MVRIAVVTYLMVAQAAGSLVCCCTVARQAASPVRLADVKAHQPPSADPPCCCHKDKGEQRGIPDSPVKSNPGGRGCPCQRGPAKNAAVLSLDSGTGKPFQQRQLLQGAVDVLAFGPPACPHASDARLPAVCEANALPFLTADDILRALHILRC
jgi:hypothetical protein